MMDLDIIDIDPDQDEVDSDEEGPEVGGVLEVEGVLDMDEEDVLAPLDLLKQRVAKNHKVLGTPTTADASTLILSDLREKYPQVQIFMIHGRGQILSFECSTITSQSCSQNWKAFSERSERALDEVLDDLKLPFELAAFQVGIHQLKVVPKKLFLAPDLKGISETTILHCLQTPLDWCRFSVWMHCATAVT